MQTPMPDQAVLSAIRRIEQALQRVEAAAETAPSPAAPDSAETDKLRAAHLSLRRTVEGAIGEIDRLLSRGEAR